MTRRNSLYSCYGKFQFQTQQAAAKVASLSSGRKSQRVTAYRCPDCHHWHTGQSIRKKKRPND